MYPEEEAPAASLHNLDTRPDAAGKEVNPEKDWRRQIGLLQISLCQVQQQVSNKYDTKCHF